MRRSETDNDDFLKLLLKIHNGASTVGFLSLAVTTAAHHESIRKGNSIDFPTIIGSLAAELRQAEADWDFVRRTQIHSIEHDTRDDGLQAQHKQ